MLWVVGTQWVDSFETPKEMFELMDKKLITIFKLIQKLLSSNCEKSVKK